MRFRPETDYQGWLLPPFFLPRKLRFWLAEQGSLKPRLKQSCRQFSVWPPTVGLVKPNRDEIQALRLQAERLAFVREAVLHSSDGQQVILARGSLQYRLSAADHAMANQAGHSGVSVKTSLLWAWPFLKVIMVFLSEVLSTKDHENDA